MQNLTTMNLVDVILHTRAPVGRLIDWIDQAFLLIHLDRASRSEMKQARTADGDIPEGAVTRVALRRIGVRSATDLLKAFGSVDSDQLPQRQMSAESLRARGLDPNQIQTLTAYSLMSPDSIRCGTGRPAVPAVPAHRVPTTRASCPCPTDTPTGRRCDRITQRVEPVSH